MAKSVQQKTERSPEEVARLRELRERYQREKPSIADLEAQGAEFATIGPRVYNRGAGSGESHASNSHPTRPAEDQSAAGCIECCR